MGVFTAILKVVQLKPVEILISKVLGAIMRKGDGGSKMSVGLSVAAVVALVIAAVKQFAPELGELLAGHEVALVGFVFFVQALFMYIRKEEII